MTAIAILAHELSHVLLHSLRHPKRDNEVFTDLVPIVIGFAETVRRGRSNISETSHDYGSTHTITATYGYLSDTEFSFAYERVHSLLSERRNSRLELLTSASKLLLTATRARAELDRFTKLSCHLDREKRPVRKADWDHIVVLHATDYTVKIENAIRNALEVAERARSFSESVTYYPKRILGEFCEHQKRCANASSQLHREFLELRNGVTVLVRNCGIGYRIREAFTAITTGWSSHGKVRERND